ncbi:uncharacterized protein PV07_00002 [Cladophialophora immunda]|uniref:Uncharacterized protein n=1 Tax=Cladophialophora immunda TaxID=569365 RepID=A0A0D1ZYF4_9EURO|nr:uncharacterized protein PV07_00002 [Cladophialophora immunda]KIW33131.1 hypothetical protein PV07_00002 [Cladophialophora immunda]
MQFGILLLSTKAPFAGLLASEDISRIRTGLNDAGQVFLRLDNNNPIISRCRECLESFIELYDSLSSPSASRGTLGLQDSNTSKQVYLESGGGSQVEASLMLGDPGEDFSWCDMDVFAESLAAGFASQGLEFSNGL